MRDTNVRITSVPDAGPIVVPRGRYGERPRRSRVFSRGSPGLVATLFVVAALASACPVEPDVVLVASGTTFSVHDYTLATGTSLAIDVTGLASGDRVYAIPFYAGGAESGTPVKRRVMTLDARYEGGSVPLRRSYFARAAFPIEERFVDASIDVEGAPPPVARAPLPRASWTPGQTAGFWATSDVSASNPVDVAYTATCMYSGAHCYVFMKSDTLAGDEVAQAWADQAGQAFDSSIHPKVTSVFGYERGGEPGGGGGIDGDQKIYIVVQDITLNCGGYFSSRDEYTDAYALSMWNRHSNEKELVNIRVSASGLASGVPLDTIAHEYQHMIEFNRYKLRLDKYQTSFLNEGLSQVAESVAGYGPETQRLHDYQSDPAVSSSIWSWSAPYGITPCYAAAYSVMDYAYRRFGQPFVEAMLSGAIGIPGVNAALSACGYAKGYAGLVLDSITAQLVDSAPYRYGAVAGYSNGYAIDPKGSNPTWYGGKIYTAMLYGLSTKVRREYPASDAAEVYDWGADCYEYLSGAGGTISLSVRNPIAGAKLRLVVVRAASRPSPVTDGWTNDWAPFSGALSLSDGIGDVAGCAGPYDLVTMKAFRRDGALHVAISCAATPSLAGPNSRLQLYLDLDGNGSLDYKLSFFDYYCYVHDGANQLVDIPASVGIRYRVGELLEIRVPLDIFPIPAAAGMKAYVRAAEYDGASWHYDYFGASPYWVPPPEL